MSLDRPFYDELRRRHRHRAALWWIIGDALYYLGLLGAAVALVVSPFFGWYWLAASPAGLLVFFTGAMCKRRSYILGAREGINVDEY